ncbi:Centrosomal protein of 128 kDa, partial [Galemys pyrenaicus]
STRVALDHLESVPEKLSLLEDFRDFRDPYSFSERMDGRSPNHSVHREPLQQHRDGTKYRVKSLKGDRSFAESCHVRGFNHSSSWQDQAFSQRSFGPDSLLNKEDDTSLPMDGRSPLSKKEEHESKKSKM